MKSLQEYLTETLIQEKFGSEIIANCMNDRFKTSDYWGGMRRYLLRWDKVKDSNLHEVTLEEALKLYRKQKESHYLIWVTKNDRYVGEGKDQIALITWGTDIVGFATSIKGMTTKACIDNFTWSHIYDVEGYEDLMQTDIKEMRRKQKEGATAIMDAEDVLRQNKERFEKALAEKHKGTNDDIIKIFNDTMAEYQNTVKNWMVKYQDIILTPHASTYQITELYKKLSKKVQELVDKIDSWNYWKDSKESVTTAKRYYDEIKQCANEIAEMCTKIIEDQK